MFLVTGQIIIKNRKQTIILKKHGVFVKRAVNKKERKKTNNMQEDLNVV